jgi:hypothetical protein
MKALVLLLSLLVLGFSFKAKASMKSYLLCQGQNTGYQYKIYPQFGELYGVDASGETVLDVDSLTNASETGFTVDLYDYEDETYLTNIVPVAPGKYAGKIFFFVEGGDAVLCILTK